MHSYQQRLPKRVRLLILGGGIHGVGLLHDMATRGWKDVHLIEKNQLGSGTSSRSTKLIHGGLRYLRNPRDFGLVFEALHERSLLKELAPDLVQPVEIALPILRRGGMPRFMLRTGLWLYDRLAGKSRIKKHYKLSESQMGALLPEIDRGVVRGAYAYWDMQTDDLRLVQRIGASAVKLGGGISEGCEVVSVRPSADGWRVDVKDPDGKICEISALYVFNALGPWSNTVLEKSEVLPPYPGLNVKGAHLLLPDIGHSVGLFLQSPEDGRMIFVLPWRGYTLVGTTETNYAADASTVAVTADDVDYLLAKVNGYLRRKFSRKDIISAFAGLRWLAAEHGRNLGHISRSDVIGRINSDRGVMYTLYGGKLTTYRRFCENLGNEITRHVGEFRPSQTMLKTAWVGEAEAPSADKDILRRFLPGGAAYSYQPGKSS